MSKYSDEGHFLIQRGTFRDVPEITGIDSIIQMDYMGAAEYEWGALPTSLKRMMVSYRKGVLKPIPIYVLGKPFTLFISNQSIFLSPLEDLAYIIDVLTSWAKGKGEYYVKMGSYLDKYFEGPTVTRIKRGCKKKTEVIKNYGYFNFWWDIEHDWMLVPNEQSIPEKIFLAFEALKNRGWGK